MVRISPSAIKEDTMVKKEERREKKTFPELLIVFPEDISASTGKFHKLSMDIRE